MTPPPPQAFVLGAAIAWNVHRSRTGKQTISQWVRRHKVLGVVGWLILTAWIVPHWWRD